MSPYHKERYNMAYDSLPQWNLWVTAKQNVCNLIGQEEYDIGHIVFLILIVHYLTRNNNIQFSWNNKKMKIKIKAEIN